MDSRYREISSGLALHRNPTDDHPMGLTMTTTAPMFPSSRSLIPHGHLLVVHLHGWLSHLIPLLYPRIAHLFRPSITLPSRLTRSSPGSMFLRSSISRRSHSKTFILGQLTRPTRPGTFLQNLIIRQCHPITYRGRPLPFLDVNLPLAHSFSQYRLDLDRSQSNDRSRHWYIMKSRLVSRFSVKPGAK